MSYTYYIDKLILTLTIKLKFYNIIGNKQERSSTLQDAI